MRVMTIASGSSGNCIYVGDDNTHILIDAGISKKKIEEGLNRIDLTLKDINGILVTHEHSDHISGLGVLERKSEIPIYSTWGTTQGIKNTNLGKMPDDIYVEVECDNEFFINSLTIRAVKTSHDANQPCAYRISDGKKTFGLLTDLGTYNDYTVNSFKGCDCILLEANHDIGMLQTGPYPYYLKQRILGDKGHLSNETAGHLLNELLSDNINEIVLGHLSKENNFPDLAYQAVRSEIDMADNQYKGDDFKISVAKRDMPGHIINI